MEIIFLGTSSATPTLRRGLSSVAMIREGETVLFDCGEGTQFSFQKAGIPRRKFHRIFITHLHGDHIFGLPGLISTLNLNQRETPLTLYGPRGLKRYVNFNLNFPRPTRLNYEINVEELAPNFSGEVCNTPGYRVLARPLNHTVPALGYRLEEHDRLGRFDGDLADRLGIPFGPERGLLQRGESLELANGTTVHPQDVVGPSRQGRVFSYCTDTSFSINARKLALDADLLVHEATYGDDALDMAIARKHATIRQAAVIAKGARVRQMAATHFSTRYDGPALHQLAAQGREVFPGLIMAEDLMRVEIPTREE